MKLLSLSAMRRNRGVFLAIFLVLVVATSQMMPVASKVKEKGGARRLEGQVPLEDQQSGRSLRPYKNNMRLVGQSDIQNRGMNGNLGWIGDCAYVAAYFGAEHPLAGLGVVDASDPKKPQLVDILPGTPGTRESQVEANEARNMVVVMPFRANTPFGDPPGPSQLQIYQAAPDDCTELTRVGTYDFGEIVTHEHRISEDGNTIYATVNGNTQPGDALQVVDVTDMSNPTLLTTYDLSQEPGMPESGVHDLDVNAGGTRAYLNLGWEDEDGVDHDGLTIVDTTEVANRVPNPSITRISTFNWTPPEGFGGSHSAQLANIEGRQYIIAMDETFTTQRCPWGWARIIDITEEEFPLQISTFRLEVNQRRNCEETLRDNAMYSSHYLGVDSVENTTKVFFTWYSSGLRVVDIRDPYDPTEIGYYIPGARTDTLFQDDSPSRYQNNKVDYTYSFVRYRPETGHIWFNSVFNGFQIVKLNREVE
jgi:hypothetical protein